MGGEGGGGIYREELNIERNKENSEVVRAISVNLTVLQGHPRFELLVRLEDQVLLKLQDTRFSCKSAKVEPSILTSNQTTNVK